MAVTIDAELARALADARGAEVPVLVTLAEGADAAALGREGMHVDRVTVSIPIVAGRATDAVVAKIARLAAVLQIEFDGEVRAIASRPS